MAQRERPTTERMKETAGSAAERVRAADVKIGECVQQARTESTLDVFACDS